MLFLLTLWLLAGYFLTIAGGARGAALHLVGIAIFAITTSFSYLDTGELLIVITLAIALIGLFTLAGLVRAKLLGENNYTMAGSLLAAWATGLTVGSLIRPGVGLTTFSAVNGYPLIRVLVLRGMMGLALILSSFLIKAGWSILLAAAILWYVLH